MISKDWDELKEWAEKNKDIHIVKILIESGLKDKEIINELKLTEKQYQDIKSKICKKEEV